MTALRTHDRSWRWGTPPSGIASGLRATLVAAMMVVGSLALATPPAAATGLGTVTGPTGTGDQSDPFKFAVTFDCNDLVGVTGTTRTTLLDSPVAGAWYAIELTLTNHDPASNSCIFSTVGQLPSDAFTGPSIRTLTAEFSPPRLTLGVGGDCPEGQQCAATAWWDIGVLAVPATGTSDVPDPTAPAVATAVRQSIAEGVEGTSSAVLVRDGKVVPVASSLSSGAGPRGGVILQAEGLTVTVASAAGARADSGVIVPTGGEVQGSLCGAFAPGSVVEAWLYSNPRLSAAVRIPADAEDGDCHLLAIPTGAPLDGGGAIEAGAHTLQLRMFTDSGFTVLATGITIGAVTPTGIPAGEGSQPLPGPLGTALVLLAGAAGLALTAARRAAVRVAQE